MNIGVFASAFHPSFGGVEEVVRQLAHAHRARGLRPVVFTNQWPRDLPARDEHEGIPILRLPMRVPGLTLKSRLTYPLTRGALKRQTLDLVKAEKIDLLHVQCASSNGFYALMARRALKLPLVVSLHGEIAMDAQQVFQRSPVARANLCEVLREADAITACSHQSLREAEEFLGQSLGDRARVLHNGIRLEEFDAAAPHHHSRPYILAIGRHVAPKGFDVLLRAYAAWRGDEPDAPDLLLAGDGEEREALEQLADELGLTGQAHFVGRVERNAAASLFQGCEFFVLPSRHEPFGIVNLEAMASGKAIVATQVGGVPELVIHEENGLLVPPEDADALHQAMSRLHRDTPLRQRLGDAGRERAQLHAWDVIADRFLEVYEFARERHAQRKG